MSENRAILAKCLVHLQNAISLPLVAALPRCAHRVSAFWLLCLTLLEHDAKRPGPTDPGLVVID